jgi:hypothetical protein
VDGRIIDTLVQPFWVDSVIPHLSIRTLEEKRREEKRRKENKRKEK